MVKLNNCVYLRVNAKTKTMMKYLLSLAAAFVLCCTMGFAQELVPVTVDYNNPKTYVVGGVAVNGNVHFGTKQIVDLSGLSVGMEVVVPGDDLTSIVKRLWNQRYFDNVSLDIFAKDSYSDTAYFVINVEERPRISRWDYTGVKKGEKDDLNERLKFRRGNELSEYVIETSKDIITRYFKEKGFGDVKVDVRTARDSVIKKGVRVTFAVDKGPKTKIGKITFEGVTGIKEYKLEKAMKKTKDRSWYNFFHSKKFNEKEYENDKANLISAFNELGYRDAKIVRDSIYRIPETGRLGIKFVIDQGKKYYFRNITWTGNSVYTPEQLQSVLMIKKGDVYDMIALQKRLYGGGKEGEPDITKLYMDEGYLFFRIRPVETRIVGDSVDVEMQIAEGKPALLNNIIINGNTITNERVIRRQVFTRPGYLFNRSQFERSVREIASLGQFEPEYALSESGYSILPDPMSSTVDIAYNVQEKPSSQFELSGGWGGNTFVLTLGLSFNNFSARRMFEKHAWRPVPLGDAQSLAIRFQTNGTYYTALSASFTEPWLVGKKPTSLSMSVYYTRQTNSSYFFLTNDQFMEVYGFAAGIGTRLKWPDNYFVLYNQLSWQSYNLKDWPYNFIFDTGVSHNVSWTINLSRTSTDQIIYPRSGSEFSLGLQLTPPYSLFRPKNTNYDAMDSQQRYRWIEYHKWTFKGAIYTKLVGDLVLMARAQFGYLGYYNRNLGYSPFEGFLLGGDGMSGYNTYGAEVISLRGYENYSLTPYLPTRYNSSGYAYAGNVYDKFTIELRHPVMLQPQSTIYVLAFLEGGNAWSDIRDFNPFQIKRSAGVGVRVFLPMVGLLGVDWGYGFDAPAGQKKSQIHFVIGQQF